jgi:hypothetical protein
LNNKRADLKVRSLHFLPTRKNTLGARNYRRNEGFFLELIDGILRAADFIAAGCGPKQGPDAKDEEA